MYYLCIAIYVYVLVSFGRVRVVLQPRRAWLGGPLLAVYNFIS